MDRDFLEHIVVNQCGKVYCKPDWRWDCRDVGKMPDLDMWVILSGKGTLKTKERAYNLSMGDCFILNNQLPFIGDTDPDFPLVVIYIHFDLYDKSGEPVYTTMPLFYRNMNNFPFFIQLLERILMLKFAKRNIEAAHWLKSALYEIKYQDKQSAISVNDSEVISHIQQLCSAIREYPEQRFNLKDEAKKVFYCPDYFARLFKKYAGTSFRNYILQSRMEAATLYLLSTTYSISRIADILGYNDIYLFSRQFTQTIGTTPTAYRKQAKNN
jgi:AraC-like DNA-binding protein